VRAALAALAVQEVEVAMAVKAAVQMRVVQAVPAAEEALAALVGTETLEEQAVIMVLLLVSVYIRKPMEAQGALEEHVAALVRGAGAAPLAHMDQDQPVAAFWEFILASLVLGVRMDIRVLMALPGQLAQADLHYL